MLLRLVCQVTGPEAPLLEIGCNVGRNLYYLFTAGFTDLTGIEISAQAVDVLKATFPDMAQRIRIHNAAAESVLPILETNSFEIVFTMAVLEHIHRDSEWLFGEIVRVTRGYLITIEDEEHISWRHFPRNYRKVFERLGLRQIHSEDCSAIPGLGPGFVARIFQKPSTGV
ncbi:MAG: class I SAM-dependent methyltransferase [Anaerolineae bacterium]|nr:class I SAM-dependent methyltransferase [Anaerolineae bacterium]